MKTYIVLFISLALGLSTLAQKTTEEEYNTTTEKAKRDKKEREPINWGDKLVYGGNVGLFIGGNSSFVQLNPMVGYKLTDWWAAGTGFNFTYFGNRVSNYSYYGPTLWTRVRPLEGFYLHTEYNYLHANYYKGPIPVWLVGGGIFIGGDNVSLGAFLMYDVLQHEYSPYRGSLVPQGGILIGF